jgi:hypothetical protein
MLLLSPQQLLLLLLVRLLYQQRPIPRAVQGVVLVGFLTSSSSVPLVNQMQADLLLYRSIKQKGRAAWRNLLSSSY